VHTLLEPIFKKSAEDRNLVQTMVKRIEDHHKRVSDIEIVLFQKGEEEKLDLFDSIFSKIQENVNPYCYSLGKIKGNF